MHNTLAMHYQSALSALTSPYKDKYKEDQGSSTCHLYLQAKVVYQVAAWLLLCKWSPMSGSLLSSHRWVPPWVFHFWPWIFHSIFLYPGFTDRGGGRRSAASSRFSQWGRHVSPWLCRVSPWLCRVSPWLCRVSPWLCRVSPCVSQHLLPLPENWGLSTQT